MSGEYTSPSCQFGLLQYTNILVPRSSIFIKSNQRRDVRDITNYVFCSSR